MQRKSKLQKSTLALSFTALATAMSVVVCRFLGFTPLDSPIRFDFGFLPIAVLAEMLGPVYSGIGYLAADIIGSFVQGYAPNPYIAVCKLLTGVIMGLFFSRGRTSLPRVIIAFSIINVAIDFVLMTPIFVFMYEWTWGVTFATRAANAAATLPFRVITFYVLARVLKKPLSRFTRRTKMKKDESFKNFANSFQAVTVPGLSRIGALCKKLGDPQRGMKFIHVAGTNGKGSTSANIACILESAGYKVGKYISPNLLKVNERISVNGEDISDEELSDLLSRIEPLSAEVEKEDGLAPTQFEIWTAAAFLYFKEKSCDYVVLEVGLGGELDATNVIEENTVAVITRLGLDHTQYLGSTIEEVAAAKAGIIKKKCDTGAVVTVEQVPEALAVIEKKTSACGLSLMIPKYESAGTDENFEVFDCEGIRNIKCGISGLHQIENAALAVKVAKLLGIKEEHIRAGIASARNPARFELIRNDPPVIYDGGHNENGIEALTASLMRYFGACEKTVIFACMADKDIEASLKMLSDKTQFIFTEVKDNPRALSADALKKKAAALGFVGEAYENVGDAYEAALKAGRLTVICGSLYLYRDFREYLNKKEI